MKKIWLLAISFIFIFSQASTCVMASGRSSSSPVGVAIKKYKMGNYTGCLQDTQSIVRRDPSNVIAYYYMAMSYAQAGQKDKAIASYQRVLALKPNATLYRYASTGKRCLETPDKCREAGESSDIDKAVQAPFGDGLSTKVRDEINQKHLDAVRQEINTKDDVNSYQFRKFNDYTNQHTQADSDNKIAVVSEKEVSAQQVNKQPTNDEIVAALKVLNQAGLANFAQGANPMAQVNNSQSQEMAQLNMLMGGNQSNGGNNNAALSMIPYMLSQNKNGGGNSYSPQLMQSMIMNSMLPDFDYSTKDDK